MRLLSFLVASLLLAPILLGCGADLGLGAGATTSGNAVGFGRVAVSTKVGTPMNEQGMLVGVAVENRAEQRVGSRVAMGVVAGWGKGPSLTGSPLGIEGFAEAGTPLHETLFRHWDNYLGAGLATPIRLESQRNLADLNRRTYILSRHVELVPLARFRVHTDHDGFGHVAQRFEVSAGLSLRLRVVTDLL